MQWILEHWPWVLFFVVVFVFFIYVQATRPVQFRKLNRQQIQEFQKGGGRVGAMDPAHSDRLLPTEQVSAGTIEGVPYEVYFATGTDTTPAIHNVFYRASSAHSFGVFKLQRPLNRIHRFLKRHGIQYYRFFDPVLDHQVDVFVDDESTGLPAALRTTAAREAIKRLLQLGATQIVKDNNGYDAVSHEPPDQPISQQRIDETLAALRDLANACSPDGIAAAMQSWRPTGITDFGPGMLYMVVPLVVACVLGWAGLWAIGRYPPVNAEFRAALLFATPVALILAVIGLVWLHRMRRRKPFSRLIYGVAVCAILAASACGSLASVLIVNGTLDRSRPNVRIKPIVDVDSYTLSGSDSDRCTALVESWINPDKQEHFGIYRDEYDLMLANHKETGTYPSIMVITHAGFLGIEWQVSYEVIWDVDDLP